MGYRDLKSHQEKYTDRGYVDYQRKFWSNIFLGYRVGVCITQTVVYLEIFITPVEIMDLPICLVFLQRMMKLRRYIYVRIDTSKALNILHL